MRVLIALVVFLAGVFLALFGFGAFSNAFAQTKVSGRGSAELSSGGVTSETIELEQVTSGLTQQTETEERFQQLSTFVRPT